MQSLPTSQDVLRLHTLTDSPAFTYIVITIYRSAVFFVFEHCKQYLSTFYTVQHF